MNKERWLEAVDRLPRTLSAIERVGLQGDRDAAFAIWQLIARAPGPIRKIYERLSEAQVLAQADSVASRLGEPDFGFSAEGVGTASREAMLLLAGHLRALDLLLAQTDLGSIGPHPEEDHEATSDGERAFLVPIGRQLWRETPTPEADFRAFSKRGFVRHRVIPAEVDGAQVILKRAHWLGVRDEPKAFGAVLFPELAFTTDDDDTSFLVIGVQCEGMTELVDLAIRDTHRNACMGTVFPELTVDDDTRNRIIGQLRSKPWLDDGHVDTHDRTPAFVVAGSWHLKRGEHHYNLATVLDGDGNPLAEYAKRLAFTDDENRVERIEPGEKLPVLVFDNCLIAFGICLDFCDRRYEHVYDQLDVDYVLIPSCGGDRTMEGHLRNAELLWLRRASLTMVVQQAYPPREDRAPGYLLPPRDKLAANPDQLVENSPWSVLTSVQSRR